MSVYKKTGRETYSYDFIYRGRRFSGDTSTTSKREAKRVEDTKREIAKAEVAAADALNGPTMTFEVAANRYYHEVGQHHKNWKTTLVNLEWLTIAIGAKTELQNITDSVVASLVAKRRGERIKRLGKKRKVIFGGLISPTTVNRTCTQPLREIIMRAKKTWKVSVSDIDFGSHMLAEPKERVREATIGEEAAIMAQLDRGYDVAIRFAFLTGCRRMEILGLEWPHVDFFSRRFTVTGKGNKSRTIPMSQEIYDLLWGQKDHHPEKVFTFVAYRTRKTLGIVKGMRHPLTESGLKSAMRRAVPDAGVTNFRFHDTRHTAATRVLRKSNLRVAQILLGHSDVKTTTKYAHALDDDIRAALEATSSPTKNPTTDIQESDKVLRTKGKDD